MKRAPAAWSRRASFVPCDHEYHNFKGGKLSKSRGGAVEVPYFLSKYDPDALRFYLTATLPDTRDTEACSEGLEGFSWEEFVERNNWVRSANEGTSWWPPLGRAFDRAHAEAWGNLANRMLSEVVYVRVKGFEHFVPAASCFS